MRGRAGAPMWTPPTSCRMWKGKGRGGRGGAGTWRRGGGRTRGWQRGGRGCEGPTRLRTPAADCQWGGEGRRWRHCGVAALRQEPPRLSPLWPHPWETSTSAHAGAADKAGPGGSGPARPRPTAVTAAAVGRRGVRGCSPSSRGAPRRVGQWGLQTLALPPFTPERRNSGDGGGRVWAAEAAAAAGTPSDDGGVSGRAVWVQRGDTHSGHMGRYETGVGQTAEGRG